MLLFAQLLNGLQYGVLLFLLAAGLTLVFGIMSFVNLAHGSLYMMGAYIAASVANATGSFLLGLLAALLGCLAIGVLLERVAVARLYDKNHLNHVLATFGMIMFFNELASMLWGKQPLFVSVPPMLDGVINLFGLPYPLYRFAVIVVGLAVAVGCYWMIHRTRLGMLIRAGANNAAMVGALGINIRFLNALLFAVGAALAGLAGAVAGPILSVQAGMGEPVLIATFVVIVIGGIGSVKGAFYSALIVGVVDTMGRAFLPMLLREMVSRQLADAAGPALASLLIYLLMAAVLALRPQGLFVARR
ncbi:branched-chain amino acid ABC transporter permease [Herbaspirillum sp. AP02]|jgi:branched-chain amino acid transport system permease protein|uniref:branched-chain amino acid ABC transporter permease n=1 Tax=Herbaspirillum TaxID=963 RepID=UPI000980FBB1|nr:MULTISPECIES: branched-chain amino acid ABC transporter permease [Herbaspirillum]MBG7619083.1 branched-chain amino acid ABC transporter permease [Herbaspirillum sp. AP02]MCI1015392.1 branched-chain amino acid ABC transporter permease [Herbaspirillum sp. C7C2]NZD66367.1 branched-chain amino acid ABC transporter permease [Herbaspirillum sp. AP21]ONN65853.1 branched-chain amino acid ABC transporter permease [Herbaspirillum sp. VT-16-41]UIN22047.1 branched-chain amino acid ABC transporter perme